MKILTIEELKNLSLQNISSPRVVFNIYNSKITPNHSIKIKFFNLLTNNYQTKYYLIINLLQLERG